jgi:hypothetical protein
MDFRRDNFYYLLWFADGYTTIGGFVPSFFGFSLLAERQCRKVLLAGVHSGFVARPWCGGQAE